MRDFLHFIKWLAIIGGALAFVLLAFCTAFFYYMMSPTTSIGKYDAVIGKAKRKEALRDVAYRHLEHFPERIPASATDAKFYDQPGFVDAGFTLLLLTLPSSETSDIEQRLRANHTALSVEKTPGFPTTIPKPWRAKKWFDQASDSQELCFGDDFICFDFSPPRTPNDTNSFLYRGVAVSQSKHQVLYWIR
jgi:hypothetical protein